jgi:hypothetical protein
VPSISGASNGGAIFFCQTCLGFDFGLIGPSFLTCSSSGSELSLVEFGGSAPPHFLKVCSGHNDKVEIKCMCSIGGKNTNRTKTLYFFFFSPRHIELYKVDVMCIVLSSYMSDKIRRMSINVVF